MLLTKVMRNIEQHALEDALCCSNLLKVVHGMVMRKLKARMMDKHGIIMIGCEQKNMMMKAEPQTPCLAMRPRETAKALGISERLLWEWTDRGVVPHIRLGKAVLYPVDALREWLRQ